MTPTAIDDEKTPVAIYAAGGGTFFGGDPRDRSYGQLASRSFIRSFIRAFMYSFYDVIQLATSTMKQEKGWLDRTNGLVRRNEAADDRDRSTI